MANGLTEKAWFKYPTQVMHNQIYSEDEISNLYLKGCRYLSTLKNKKQSHPIQSLVDKLKLNLINKETSNLNQRELKAFLVGLNTSFSSYDLHICDLVEGEVQPERLILEKQEGIKIWKGLDQSFLIFNSCEFNEIQSALMCMILELLYTSGFDTAAPPAKEIFYHEIFQQIDDPSAIFNIEGNLMLYNKAFTDLNVTSKDCLSFVHKDKVTIDNCLYYIHKKDIQDGQFFMIIFISEEMIMREAGFKTMQVSRFSDLGIITSSLAHELNNPLAGILAGVEYLKMENNNNSISELDEIENAAKRCQELVKVFLGFSKKNVSLEENSYNLKNTANKARDLLKYRMAESGLSFGLNFFSKKEFKEKLNETTMIMVFYLIFNEILTYISTHSLITQASERLFKWNFIVTTFEERIEIEIEGQPHLTSKIKFGSQRLLKHLLSLHDWSFFQNENSISLSKIMEK